MIQEPFKKNGKLNMDSLSGAAPYKNATEYIRMLKINVVRSTECVIHSERNILLQKTPIKTET